VATTFKPAYASGAAVTLSLSALGSSSTLTSGQQSSEIDNTSALYDDLLLSGFVTTGISPVAGQVIQLSAAGWDAQANAYPDTLTGAGDAAKTLTSANVLLGAVKPLITMVVDSTNQRSYYFSNLSVAAAFGGVLPQKIVLFIAHNTGVNLAAVAGQADQQGLQWQGV
jgi:hypothetical protein